MALFPKLKSSKKLQKENTRLHFLDYNLKTKKR